MFQNLRSGTPLYVLHKDTLQFETGEVISVSPARPQTSQNYGIGIMPPQQMVIDVEVNLGGKNIKIPNLLTNLSITDCDNNVVVSDSREVLSTEVSVLESNSQKILDSTDYHKDRVQKCQELQQMLNPQKRQDAERAKEIETLAQRVGGLEGSMGRIEGMLSQFLKGKNKKEE